MLCTCPVCLQAAEYAPRYLGKWHRCRAGCQGGTRMVVVPGGMGLAEDFLEARWRGRRSRGRWVRSLAALASLALALFPLWQPWLGPAQGSWALSLLVGGLGAALTCAWSQAALGFSPPRPAGL